MYNSTHEIDFEQLRAKRAADILNLNPTPEDERDEVGERLDEGLCAACGAPCPVGLCEDCGDAGAHVAGPGITGDGPDAADWLDDWGGLHTLDDGHPGSYDHEAVATTDSVTVTLSCECGSWTGSAPADTDEAPEGLFAEWRVHVYVSTGRGWVPSSESLDDLRAGLDRLDRSVTEMDRSVAAMRDIPVLAEGDDDGVWTELDADWASLVEAHQAEATRRRADLDRLRARHDRLRALLDAGDWPALLAEVAEQRTELKGRRGVLPMIKLSQALATAGEAL